jgi:uncharacterized protein (DUF697 family)
LLSAVAAYVPGWGTAASATLGIGSTLTNLGVDLFSDNTSTTDAFTNFGKSVSMDILGLIPGMGLTSKAKKFLGAIKPISTMALSALAVCGLTDAYNALQKGLENPESLDSNDI